MLQAFDSSQAILGNEEGTPIIGPTSNDL
jgi:hypothetical protein